MFGIRAVGEVERGAGQIVQRTAYERHALGASRGGVKLMQADRFGDEHGFASARWTDETDETCAVVATFRTDVGEQLSQLLQDLAATDHHRGKQRRRRALRRGQRRLQLELLADAVDVIEHDPRVAGALGDVDSEQ